MQHNSGIFKCLNIFHLNQIFSAEERGCERAAGDVADLQAHEAGQAHHPLQGANTPAQVPTRHLRVSLSYILHVTCYMLHVTSYMSDNVSTFDHHLHIEIANSCLLPFY